MKSNSHLKMTEQCASTVLMVRPAHFGYNEQTEDDNAFQSQQDDLTEEAVHGLALSEFDALVAILRDQGVEVFQVEDTDHPIKPDAIFPNNWVTFHANGAIITYALRPSNRRAERREDVLDQISERYGFDRRYSLEHYEDKHQFLEATGSMVFDRPNKMVYACISERTNPLILDKFCALTGFGRKVFRTKDPAGHPIYHTNVMMCIGEMFAVICTEVVDPQDRQDVVHHLEKAEKEVIEITYEQLTAFAGNMIQLKNQQGESFILMSKQAYHSLDPVQIDRLKSHGKLLPCAVPTIESIGGGSVRCMVAEIFPPHRLS